MPQQRVNIPGVGIVEFPDTMSRPDIDTASKRLYNESLGPMKWPPGEPSERGLASRAMGAIGSLFDRPEGEPEFESLPESDPRAVRGGRPIGSVGLLPTAAGTTGGTYSNIPEPQRTQIQEEWHREMGQPLIPLGEMAEKMYPDRPDEGLAYQWERGFGIGINRLAAGFTSPTTIATVIGAYGLGAVNATLRILVGLGFTVHIATGAIEQSPEIVQLVKEGKTSDAVAKGTEVMGSLLLATTIGKHTVRGMASHPAVTGRGMVLDPRGPGGAGRPPGRGGPGMEPRVFEEGAGLEVLPAHEGSLFPGRPTELPGGPQPRGLLPPYPREPAPGRPGVPSTQGIYGRGAPPEPGVRGLLPEAPGYDVPGAGPGRLFRGGARMGEPAPTMEGGPRVAGEQTVVPTGRPQGLFGADPSNLLRRQQQAPDFVGPMPEARVRPEPGQRLLGPGPDVALPPGGGPMVTRVQPGEPGGLEPFRQGDVGPWGRPGEPARVREPGRFPVRDQGDPSSDLLTDAPEPTVRPEGPIEPEYIPPEAKVEGEMRVVPEGEGGSFVWESKQLKGGEWGVYRDGDLWATRPTEAEAADYMRSRPTEAEIKAKVVKEPKSRWQIGQEWYAENSMERAIVDEGGMKLDMKVSEENAMVMPNMGARRGDRGRNMFDPIRTLKGQGGHTPDQMFHILQDNGVIPKNWDQGDFMEAMSDRTPGSKGSFPNREPVDVFEQLDAEAERMRPEGFEPEAPERLVPDVGERMAPETRAAGQQPRTVEEAEADYQKGRAQIKAMREEPGYEGTDFEALEVENSLTYQRNLDRINPPKPTTIGPGFGPEEPAAPKADIPAKPKVTVRGEMLRKETFEEMNDRLRAEKEGLQAQTDAFREAHGEVGFQIPMEGEGRYIVLHPSVRPESRGKWQASYFDKGGPSGHHIEETWTEAVKDLQNNYDIDLSKARVKSMENLNRDMTNMEGYDVEAEAARNRQQAELTKRGRGRAEHFLVRALRETVANEAGRENPNPERIKALRIMADNLERGQQITHPMPVVVPEGTQFVWKMPGREPAAILESGKTDNTGRYMPTKVVEKLEGWDADEYIQERFPEGEETLSTPDWKWLYLPEKIFEGGKPPPKGPVEPTVKPEGKVEAKAPKAEEFPERVGIKEEPTVTPEGPDLERIRKPRKKAAPRAEIKTPYRTAKLEQVEGYEAELKEIESKKVVQQVEELPEDMRSEGPEVQEFWAENADEYQRLATLHDEITVTGLNAAETKRVNAVLDRANERMAELEEQSAEVFNAADRLLEDGAPGPGEPKVEPETKGQVEIVGQKGFERESKLADDKAKLEMLLSARPNQQTAAGRKAIRDNAKRERLLRADIAEQERLLRNEPEQAGMFGEEEPPLFADEPKVEPETTKEEKAGLFSEEEPQVQPEGKKPPRVPKEEKEGLYSEEPEPTKKYTAQGEKAAQALVESTERRLGKDNPVTSYVRDYLDWRRGIQAFKPELPTGVKNSGLAKSQGMLVDTLLEIEGGPKGPPGQSTLHMNPIGAMMDMWSKNYGPRLAKYIMSTEKPYGLLVKPLPEPLKWLFLTRHRQPPEWVEAHQAWEHKIGEGAAESFKLGKEMTVKLSQKDQLKLGELLRGEATEADLRAMKDNPRWNEAIDAVKTARARFDEWGAQAAQQGLLSQETFFKNYGRYMPRLYRRWEVDYEGQLKKWNVSKPTRLDMDRWKKLGDIPEEVRVMMGEIKEPGYPVAKGLSQIIHDVETAKLFNKVADHPDWTYEPEKFWDLGKDPKQYTLMPESKALGRLSGKYVNKYIASVLNQMTVPRGQYHKVTRALVSEWKFNKVIFNPATHARNMVSNTMLAYLSGLPPWRVDIYSKAMIELYQQKGPHYDAAKAQGLFTTTFAKGELGTLIDAWNQTHGGMYDRIAGMSEHFAKGEIAEGLGKIKPSTWKVGQRAAKIYQGEEAWFKLAKYIQEVENGATPKAAAAAAQKALFDYTEVPPFVEWARTSPIGAPFITFTWKALPQILETGITHPWRLGSLVAGIYAMEEGARQHLGIEEDQMALLKRIMPDRMRDSPLGLGPKSLLLPFKDKYGQLLYLDLTYILPWGDVGETGSTGILSGTPGYAGPLRAVAEVMLNTSGFTGEDIYGEHDSLKEKVQKISDYLYKFAAPSLAPGGYGFDRLWASGMGIREGKADYFGRVSSPATAVASAILGMKTNPISPEIELFFRKKDFEDGFDDLKAAAFRVRNHKGLSTEEKQKQLKDIQGKAIRLREEADAMFRGPRSERE